MTWENLFFLELIQKIILSPIGEPKNETSLPPSQLHIIWNLFKKIYIISPTGEPNPAAERAQPIGGGGGSPHRDGRVAAPPQLHLARGLQPARVQRPHRGQDGVR